MQSVDKNDVNISKLFVWKKRYDIEGINGEDKLSVWIRVVGDADLNKARVYALRKSAELRKAFKEDDSYARLIYLSDMSDIPEDNIIQLILVASATYVTRQALEVVQTPYPVEPNSDADLELMEKFQSEVDGWAQKRNDDLKKYIEEQLEKIEKELKSKTKDELVKEYEKLVIASACENEMIKSFREMCVFYACYLDENLTEHLFQNFEDFENLPEFYKKQFVDLYREVEINTDELKK